MDIQEHFLRKVIALIFDYDRTNCYNRFLKKYAKDKIIVDCGSGSGILSWLALKHGAKAAYALEIIPSVLEHLQSLTNITPNFHVKEVDILTENLPIGDLYIHEIFGHTIFDEGIHHLVDNCKRQGITELYPKTVTLYSASKRNFDVRSFDRNLDKDKFSIELLDPEVREFVEILEDNFYGKIDYLDLLETDAKVMILSDNTKPILSERTCILNKSLFDLTPSELPNLSNEIISWGFHFDENIGLDLDTCRLTTWLPTISNKFYKSNIRRILPTKNYHHKPNRLKAYRLGVRPGSTFN